MKFKHLHIENIRSYQTLDLDFPDGVTVISGVNGSGKSSILEACFMGIFGGEVLRGTALQIPDMIRKDSSKAVVVLDFEHAGDDYQIEQHYRQTKTGANNAKSVLRKNGEIIAEQAKNTYEAIQNLLNMDEKNFQNCAYIRQGDVDALINAKPKDRQQMIDDLLRLGKLEEYRERAHNSKTAVTRVLRSENDKKESVSDKISQLRSKNLHEELNRRRAAVEKINASIAKENEEKEELSRELTLLDSKLLELEKDRAEIKTLTNDAAELNSRCDLEISSREKLLQEILDSEQKIADITAASGRLRSEINDFKNRDDASILTDFPSLRISEEDSNIEAVLTSVRAEESKALNVKHDVSKESEVIGVQKSNFEKDMRQKEDELSELKLKREKLNETIEEQTSSVSKANAAVAGGLSKADAEKAAFLKLFDELFGELQKSASEHLPEHDPNPNATETECISDVCDISFYSSVVKAGELPLPSDEPSWRTMISDIENLEAHISGRIRSEEAHVTEAEKKKASIKGELDEKERSIEETENDLRRLEDEKVKTNIDLKNESAEFEKKKKLAADFAALIEMHGSKRNEKLKAALILKETVPSSRYQFNDISAKDVTDAYEILSARKEGFISEIASLESRDKEIAKSILKKEDLLRAGKCPTCGQAVTADATHPEHGTDEEVKLRADIAARLAELSKLKADADTQSALLKEISQIDEKTEQIKADMSTARAEEKGKAEMIEKFRRDLEENERQKAALNARKLEQTVFCDARRKDLEKINERLTELQAENDRRNEKAELLSEREKRFSDAANEILLAYKTLEAERNMSAESKKRLEELDAQKEVADKILAGLRSEADKINTQAVLVKAKEEQAGKVYDLVSDVRAKIETLAELGNSKNQLKAILGGRKTTMAEQNKTIDNYKKQISDKEIKIKNLTAKIDGVSGDGGVSISDKKQQLTEQIRAVSASVAKWDIDKTNILKETGRIQSELTALSDYEKEAETLRNKLLFLSFVSEDVSVLEEMYLRIRSDMRTKNIEALDRLLNEMFDFIYSNNAYSHLELDSDYNLKVHEKDGSVLEPKQLSGGERAIFNLALRCAIYRLLSLGFGENSAGKTSLPPLIFDEPTVFLDSGHVRQLIKLIEHMREDGVGQIIVVSHDESLIDSADVNFKVEKDPLTNASSVV